MTWATTGDGPSRWEDVGTIPRNEWFREAVQQTATGEIRLVLHAANGDPVLETRDLPLMWDPTDAERSAWREWFRRHGIDMDQVRTPVKITRDLRQYRVTYKNILGEPIMVQLEGPPLPFPPMRHLG